MGRLVLGVLCLAIASHAQNSTFLGELKSGIKMQQEARATEQTLEAQRQLMRAEQERLRAETEVLREQLRRSQHDQKDRSPEVDLEEQKRLINGAVERLVRRHPDVQKHADTLRELSAYFTSNPQPSETFYDLYFQSLYLLTRYVDEGKGESEPR